jgi:hypothetical protein
MQPFDADVRCASCPCADHASGLGPGPEHGGGGAASAPGASPEGATPSLGNVASVPPPSVGPGEPEESSPPHACAAAVQRSATRTPDRLGAMREAYARSTF